VNLETISGRAVNLDQAYVEARGGALVLLQDPADLARAFNTDALQTHRHRQMRTAIIK